MRVLSGPQASGRVRVSPSAPDASSDCCFARQFWDISTVSEADVSAPSDLPAPVRDYLVRVTDVYRTHDLDAMVRDGVTADVEFIDHRPLGADPVVGRDAARSWLQTVFEFIPDFNVHIEVLAHNGGDIYLARDTYTGKGTAVGQAETQWYVVDRLRDGKLAREDIFGDEATARAAFDDQRATT